MKLSDIRGEAALDVIAKIIDPVAEIAKDEKVVDQVRSGQRLMAVKTLLTGHKKSVLEVMAYLEGEDPSNYRPPLLKLPAMLLDILNDPDFTSLFSSGETDMTSSGSPTENIEAVGK